MSRGRILLFAVAAVLVLAVAARFVGASGYTRFLLSLDTAQRAEVAEALRLAEERRGPPAHWAERRVTDYFRGATCENGATGTEVSVGDFVLGVAPIGGVTRVRCGEVLGPRE